MKTMENIGGQKCTDIIKCMYECGEILWMTIGCTV